ncbi:monovalent cation:proton antiporter family protein [Thermaerobacter subterraneus]|uniref:Kef-type K+ transport system, membrane component n=1 Tax=Thermaerobacter subterraneus DSM 13965 TaxID=867903 RepID=K6PZ80_9FIRM|nr:cation:proton antiporter [Thermaerobacter subterraneus]EKP94063.1 Kef-type K+ transport system, membrane component [Thermaerobacter subterraneus DSM 13965]
MEQAHDFTSLLIITLLAFAVPLVAGRIRVVRVPAVVAEILAGIVIGRSGLQWVQPEPWLDFLSTLGFAYLMFLSGLEIDFSQLSGVRPVTGGRRGRGWRDGGVPGAVAPGAAGLGSGPVPRPSAAGEPAAGEGECDARKGGSAHGRAVGRAPLVLGLVTFALTVLLALGVSFVLFRLGFVRNPYLMALVLSTTSVGIVVPVLKEYGLTGTDYGQTILVSAVIADFATMLLITAMVVLMTGSAAADLLLLLVLFAAVFLFYRLGAAVIRWRLLEDLPQATAQMGVRGAFALILVFIALSEALGVEVILGAFLAGVIISLLTGSQGSALHAKLDAIGYGFLVPIFFINVGAQFDLRAVTGSDRALWLVPLLLAGAYLVKLVPALAFRWRYSWRQALAAGTLLSARLSLIIAAASIGVRLGVLEEAVSNAVVLVAIVTATFSPLLFERLTGRTEAPPPARLVVLVGGGERALVLADRLRSYGRRVHLVDTPGWRQRALDRGYGYTPVPGWDGEVIAGVERVVEELGPERIRTLAALSREPELNVALAARACQRGVGRAVAFIQGSPELARRARELGVEVVSPALAEVAMLEMLLEHPSTWRLLAGEDRDYALEELEVRNPRLHGRPLRRVRLPGDCLVLNVMRGEERLIPHGDTRLRLGDQLTVIGSHADVAEARLLLSGED